MKVLNIALIAASLLVSGAVFANHHEGAEDAHPKHKMMEEADANKDGKISFDEFKAAREKHMEEHFKKIDTNSDGFIDEAERKAMREKMKEMHQKRKNK